MKKTIILIVFILSFFTAILPAFSTEYPSSTDAVISSGGRPSEIAMTSGGNTIYVTNALDGTISKIDTATNQVIGTLTGFIGPNPLVITNDDSKLYVSEYGVWCNQNTVAVVNLATSQINRITVGQGPLGITISRNNNFVYVASRCSGGYVHVINTHSNQVVANIYVGGMPNHVTLSRDDSKLYVSNWNGYISEIDTITNTVAATFDLGHSPYKMAISLGGKYMYAANYGPDSRGGEHTVSVIDLATRTEVALIDVGVNAPYDAVLTSCGSYLLVSLSNWDSTYNNNQVAVIDTVTNQVVDHITVQSNPFDIALNADSSKAFVVNAGSNSVTALSGAGCIFYQQNSCGGGSGGGGRP